MVIVLFLFSILCQNAFSARFTSKTQRLRSRDTERTQTSRFRMKFLPRLSCLASRRDKKITVMSDLSCNLLRASRQSSHVFRLTSHHDVSSAIDVILADKHACVRQNVTEYDTGGTSLLCSDDHTIVNRFRQSKRFLDNERTINLRK